MVVFICFFFFACADNVFIRRKSQGYAFFPNVGMKYNLFCLYLSFTKELFPSPSRPSDCQAGYDSEDVIWKKSTEKKRFPLPHQQKPTPSYQLWFTRLRCKFKIQLTIILKHTLTTNFSYAKKEKNKPNNLAYIQPKKESYLIIQKLPPEEIPSGSLSHLLCSEAPIVVLSFIKSPEKYSKREPHTTISELYHLKKIPQVFI